MFQRETAYQHRSWLQQQPIFDEIETTAARREACSPSCSRTIRTAGRCIWRHRHGRSRERSQDLADRLDPMDLSVIVRRLCAAHCRLATSRTVHASFVLGALEQGLYDRQPGRRACSAAPLFSSSFACLIDADPCFVDKTLDVLIRPAEQIAFDNERAAADRLGAAFLEVDASHWLISCARLALGARPAV